MCVRGSKVGRGVVEGWEIIWALLCCFVDYGLGLCGCDYGW